jgi:2-iminobutanoate/2-iminopropanoate deaminase
MTRQAFGRTTESGFSTSAIKGAGFVFTSGSIGLDPESGDLPEDIEAQTRNTLLRLHQILKDADTSLANVIKVNVYLDNIEADFDPMNEAYRKYFSEQDISEPPARTTVGCRLPWSKVEMDMVSLASTERRKND